MPGVRGFSGLLFLRSERPSTPVIVVSGNEDRAVIRHCLEFGAAGFIPKSNSLETMREAIAQVLDGGRWTPPDFDPNAQPNRESSALARRLASLTPAADPRADDAVAGPAQQADRLRAQRLGGDGQGARLGDPAEARRREPHPGGHSGDQDRDRRRNCRSRPDAGQMARVLPGQAGRRGSRLAAVLPVVDQVADDGGSASVEVSPSAPYSFSAILRRMRRMILPERVFGSRARTG